ncbi:MAG TPA: response regulator [Polyangia bacterium]|jgi:CheY-like chemotaxis protein
MTAPSSGTGNVVLLVEDDEDIRASTAESLESEGFAVIGAEGVDEGLSHLRQGPPPVVILLDLMMPGRNGWDFRQDQLADPALREIPVVVITASGIGAESLRRDMGDVQLVAKPFTCESLLRAIARATVSEPVNRQA